MMTIVLSVLGVLSLVVNVLALRAMEARIVQEVKCQKLMVEEHMQWLSRYAAPSIASKLGATENQEKPAKTEKPPGKKRGRPRKKPLDLEEINQALERDNDRQLSAAALLEAPTLTDNELPDLPDLDDYDVLGQRGES